MTIQNKPTIYNTPTIYKTGAGSENGAKIGDRYYKITKIGDRYWTTENLELVYNGLILNASAGSSPYACYYLNNGLYSLDSERKCGLLYNWQAIKKIIDDNILENGWRVPSENDFNDLISFVGGPTVAGKLLKSESLDWCVNWNGSNDFEFNMLPSGNKHADNAFYDIATSGYLYTSTEYSATNARFVEFTLSDNLNISNVNKNFFMSLRLCKDA